MLAYARAVRLDPHYLEEGADVNSKDSFYEATPLTWASFNDHVEIVALLLKKGATGADGVLASGVRSGDKALVAAALEGQDLTPEAVLRARKAAAESSARPSPARALPSSVGDW